MVTDADVSFDDFTRAVSEFLDPLVSHEGASEARFYRLCQRIDEFATASASAKMLPRTELQLVHKTILALRNEHARTGSERTSAMADELEFLFGLILLGESRKDRVPGVPRVL